MRARFLILLLGLVGTAWGAGLKFKDLFDPGSFPLSHYTWKEWEDIDKRWKDLEEGKEKERLKREAKKEKLEARGIDPAEWDDPPPKTEEEKKEEEEKRKKREEENKKHNLPKYPRDRVPGFKYGHRLATMQNKFREMVEPASASKLEGIVKQLKVVDAQADKFQEVVDEAADEYVSLKEQMDKATDWQIKKSIKKTGKPPKIVQVPAQLQANLFRASKRLQEMVALQQSQRQFEDWFVEELAKLLNELNDDELAKPLAALDKGIKSKDYRYRVRCAELLGRMKQQPSQDLFKTALEKEADPMVLAEMVRIHARTGRHETIEILAKRLEDERWPVRAAVIAELGRIPHRNAVDVLVKQMAKEKGRLLDDIATALKDLTKQRFAPEPDPWRIWWEKVHDSWTPPPPDAKVGEEKAGERKGVYFYGIQTTSKRIVFCIDFSGSMDFPLDGEGGKKAPRIESAKRELFQALSALPEDAEFNIVTYNSAVSIWKKRMQPATLKNKQVARKFVEKQKPAGATNIYDALNKSLDIAAAGAKAKRKEKDVPVADTIFFLTDGQPTNGRVVDAAQILKEVTARNKMLDVVIHTVGVSNEQNASFLLNLAKFNKGRYVAFK